MATQNRIKHFDLYADDVLRAKDFYVRTFGWAFEKWEHRDNYYMIDTGNGEEGIDGSLTKSKGNDKLNGQITISVKNIFAKSELIKKNGGEIISDAEKIYKIGNFIKFKDTEGNILGMIDNMVEDGTPESLERRFLQ